MISLQVHGLKELNVALLALGAELGAKVLARAARKAFAPVLADARAKVPVDTGLLQKSLRIVSKKTKEGDTVVQVGLRVAVGKGGAARDIKGQAGGARKSAWRNSAHWRWHFVELGTANMPAHPFLRPALDRNANHVLSLLKVELAKGIQRAVKRQARIKKGSA